LCQMKEKTNKDIMTATEALQYMYEQSQ